ncbi:MAG: hypothetical protein VKJ04_06455 [Vampirovibrionales bacterium]|nr:hypothetical protein [Vampirovibrionales bacterium]
MPTSKLLVKHAGQSVMEMGLLVSLVALASIVSWTVLSGSLNDAFIGMGQSSASSQTTPLVANIMSPPASGDTSAPLSAQGDNLTLASEGGSSFDLGNYPADLSQSIETAGANGTTQLLLATLDKVISQAVARGELAPEEANQLKALSQQGHSIGNLIGTIETIVDSGQNMASGEGPANQIGFNPASGTEGEAIQKFRQLLSASDIQDPRLKQTVDVLANQIINIANGVEGAYFQVKQGTLLAGETFDIKVVHGLSERDQATGTNTQQSLGDLAASAVVHHNANAICQAGKAGDNCRTK